MGLTRILSLEQRTPEWDAWRGGLKFSASRAAAWLGESDYAEETPRRVAMEVLGFMAKKNLAGNPNARRGVRVEDQICEMVSEMTGEVIMPGCIERTDRPFIIASLDGYTVTRKLYEFKAPGVKAFTKAFMALKADASFPGPADYVAQLDHQLLAGKDIADENNLVMYLTDEERAKAPADLQEAFKKPLWFKRRLSAEREASMLKRYDELMALLLAGELPEPDPVRDVFVPSEDRKDLLELSERYLRAELNLGALERQVKNIKAGMKQDEELLQKAMGEFSVVMMPNGMRMSVKPHRGSISWQDAYRDLAGDEFDTETHSEQFRGEGSLRRYVTFPKDKLKGGKVVALPGVG